MDQIAFLFPGQGAQTVGMGRDFYENYTAAREVFQWGDELLSYALSKLIFEGPMERLTETRHSQLAIFITSCALLAVIKKEFPHFRPSFCAGLSLGEYTALMASGRVDFETCLPLVQFRAEAMNAACEVTSGAMAALFGLSAGEVERLVTELEMPKDLWIANYNCPGQIVISGTVRGIEKGIVEAKNRGAKRAIALKVHGAFHSPLMQTAEERLASRLMVLPLEESEIALVMNATGKIVSDNEQVRANLMRQVTSPVRWEEGIRALMPRVNLFVEIGCGKVLTGLNKQIGVAAPTLPINQIPDLEQLAKFVVV
jgi:[acyl-carrier-protein] S-malonyltransferase